MSPYRDRVTLDQAILRRANSLNVVRLCLAASVIFLHAWPITGRGSAPVAIDTIAGFAVPGFFCLSGFLIAASQMHLSLPRFLLHRSIRIFPALWVVLVLTALVAAPLSTVGGGTWTLSAAVPFVLDNARLAPYPRFNITGTVADEAWNGSLWSLPIEFTAYIAAALLLTLAIARRHARLIVTAVLGLTVVAGWWAAGPGEVTTVFYLRSLVLATYFVAGMALYFWADRVKVDARLAALSLALVVMLQFPSNPTVGQLDALPLAYLLLWVGAVIPPRWAQTHDISYGVYIYAGPVQRLTYWLAPAWPLWLSLGSTIWVTVLLAWASWLLIERPALRLRKVASRRRAAETAPVGSSVASVEM